MELGRRRLRGRQVSSRPARRHRSGWSRCPSSAGARPGHPPAGAAGRHRATARPRRRRRFGSPGWLDRARPDRRREPAGRPVEIRSRMVSTGVGFMVSSMCCRTSLMAGSSAPSPLRSSVPTVLDEPLGFIDAAQLAEHRHEQDEQGGPIVARILRRRRDEPLGGRESPGFVKQTHPPRDRSLRERGARRDPRPGFAGRLFRPRASSQSPGGKRFPRSSPPSRTGACPGCGRRSHIGRPRSPTSISSIAPCNGDRSTKPSRPRRVPPRKNGEQPPIVAACRCVAVLPWSLPSPIPVLPSLRSDRSTYYASRPRLDYRRCSVIDDDSARISSKRRARRTVLACEPCWNRCRASLK